MAAKFRQIGKRMAFWADAEHELAMSTSNGLGQTDYSIVPSATGTLVAYNKPAVTGVNKVFTLKKGDKYIYLTVKFSSPYSFIQIKDLKTQKTGWVGVKTSQLKLAAEVGQEEKPVEENTNTQKKKQTITVNKTIVKTYREGEIFSLGARAPGKLTYASNNTNVAVVSKTGLVKITGCGTAVIIVNAAATAEYESATAAVRLTVNSWDEVQFLSLTSEKKGYLMFRWGKNSRMSGYRIEFSSNKAFNPAKKGTADKNVTQGTAQGLISGQVYYARIRGYRVVNDQIIYGPWSAVKSCRVK